MVLPACASWLPGPCALCRGETAFDLSLLGPTLYLAFAALAVLAPLSAGGGNELYPAEQLAAYPVRPRTWFGASLLLAPLNLAWATQVVALAAVTSLVTAGPAGPVPGHGDPLPLRRRR